MNAKDEIEWSSRHVRLAYQATIFSLIFLILNIYQVDLKFPFIEFSGEHTKPEKNMIKIVFLCLSIWFLTAFIFQTNREKKQNTRMERELVASLSKLNEIQGLCQKKISYIDEICLSNETPEKIKEESITALKCLNNPTQIIKNHTETVNQSVQKLNAIANKIYTDLSASIENFAFEDTTGQLIRWRESVQYNTDVYGQQKLPIVHIENELKLVNSNLGQIVEVSRDIPQKVETNLHNLKRIIDEVKAINEDLDEKLDAHLKAIRSSNKWIDFYDNKIRTIFPIFASALFILLGLIFWIIPPETYLTFLYETKAINL